MLNYSQSTTTPDIENTCKEINDELMALVGTVETKLHKVRNLVRGQRAAIVAELGNDNATALQAVYTKLKEAVEAAKDVTLEDMPTD